MPDLLTPADWTQFENAINDAMHTFSTETVTWRHFLFDESEFGETTKPKYTDITLHALPGYNVFRTWPVDRATDTGSIDQESLVLYFSKSALATAGHINPQGNFKFRPSKDKFIIEGVVYVDSGNTSSAQASVGPLLIQLILKRESPATGEKKYDTNG